MDLHEALQRFDGKHTSELMEAVQMVLNEGLQDELASACEQSELEVAATWVFKVLMESSKARGLNVARVFRSLRENQHWEAQLHVLQSVQYAPNEVIDCAEQIKKLMAANRTLVRVWALDAFVRIANERKEMRAEALELAEKGLRAKAASERARCRALQKYCAKWDL